MKKIDYEQMVAINGGADASKAYTDCLTELLYLSAAGILFAGALAETGVTFGLGSVALWGAGVGMLAASSGFHACMNRKN